MRRKPRGLSAKRGADGNAKGEAWVTKRIIPCLDVRDGRVVKGVNFEGLSDVSDPVALAAYYTENLADELVFYDITATAEGRGLFTDVLRRVAPGGVHPPDRGRRHKHPRRFRPGAEMRSRQGQRKFRRGARSVAHREAAKRYGDQCVVLSVDVKRVGGKFTVFTAGGRVNTGN